MGWFKRRRDKRVYDFMNYGLVFWTHGTRVIAQTSALVRCLGSSEARGVAYDRTYASLSQRGANETRSV